MHRLTHSLKRAMAFQTNIEGQADNIYDSRTARVICLLTAALQQRGG